MSFTSPRGLLKILCCFSALFLFSSISLAEISKYRDFVHGSLSEVEAEKVVIHFSREFDALQKDGKPLYQLYKAYVDKLGVQRISNFLEKDSMSCHGVAHGLGRLIAERVEELNIGMGICASTCTYACLHGVFKAYFSNLGKDYGHHGGHESATHNNDEGHEQHRKVEVNQFQVSFTNKEFEKFSADVNKACDESDAIVAGFYQGNCAHGVGHAIGRLAQDTALANKYCKLFAGIDMQFYCETGVFMEYANKLQTELYVGKLKRSEKIKIALEYCNKNSFYPSACLRFLLPRNKSLGQISRFSYLCARQNIRMKNHCYNAMGYYSRKYVANNPEEFPYVCGLKNKEEQDACISGVSLMKKDQRYREQIKTACSDLEKMSQREFCDKQVSTFYYKLDNAYLITLLKSS